ncbi:hypothetical protein BGX34_001886 [Mortierella sp. NVP85]|nr:hypothetical protein BGX34_001886 [Mortierella sp. NVP85]
MSVMLCCELHAPVLSMAQQCFGGSGAGGAIATQAPIPIPAQYAQNPGFYNPYQPSGIPRASQAQPTFDHWAWRGNPPFSQPDHGQGPGTGYGPEPYLQTNPAAGSLHVPPILTSDLPTSQAAIQGDTTTVATEAGAADMAASRMATPAPTASQASVMSDSILAPSMATNITSSAPAFSAMEPPPSSSSSYSSIPSYLRAYISKEPIFRSPGLGGHPLEGETKGSQSQELRTVLNRIATLDSTLDALAHSVEDLQREKHKGNLSLGQDLVPELSSRLGEKVVDVMCQESGKQMDALQQETRGVMDFMREHLQQIPVILEETVRKELEGWEKTTQSFLSKEIRDLKRVVALQTEMLTTVTEQNRGISSEQARLLKSMASRMESSSQSISRGPAKPITRRQAVPDWTTVSRESSLGGIEVHCISDTDSGREHTAPVPTCTSAVSPVTVSNLDRNKSPSEPQRPARTDEEASTLVPILPKRNRGRTPAIVDHEARRNTCNTSPGLVCLKLSTAQPKRKRGRPRKQTRAAVSKRVEAEQPEEEADVKAEDDGSGDLGSMMTRSKRKKQKLENTHIDLEWAREHAIFVDRQWPRTF